MFVSDKENDYSDNAKKTTMAWETHRTNTPCTPYYVNCSYL